VVLLLRENATHDPTPKSKAASLMRRYEMEKRFVVHVGIFDHDTDEDNPVFYAKENGWGPFSDENNATIYGKVAAAAGQDDFGVVSYDPADAAATEIYLRAMSPPGEGLCRN
jgi:hypothetical protein